MLRRVVDSVLDKVIESGHLDLVLDLANPVPAIMTMHLLGLPLSDWDIYARPAHEGVFTPPDSPERSRVDSEMTALHPRMLEAIAGRRREPREDDLLSHLAQVEIDGRSLPDEEILEIAMLVLLGGVDTTTSLMANALLYLHQDRDARQRLLQEPRLRPLACEEFLRWVAPVQTQARTATKDVQLGGCRIRSGDRILVSWASANRDERMFERPDEVILDRQPNRHLAFAVGIHRCIGSNLARSQFLAVLDAVLTRLPDYEVVEDQVERYQTIGMINGIVRMPSTFTPGPQLGNPII
jgi:cytochrome P450